MCFFFQAEDGIRDKLVTGVQTCALPIFRAPAARRPPARTQLSGVRQALLRGREGGIRLEDRRRLQHRRADRPAPRSEERRVGKECRSPWRLAHEKKKERIRSTDSTNNLP